MNRTPDAWPKIESAYAKTDWRRDDSLDGIPLRDGESILLRWPDGSITQEEVVIVKQTILVPEQGSLNGSPAFDYAAHIHFPLHGMTLPVRISGMAATRTEA